MRRCDATALPYDQLCKNPSLCSVHIPFSFYDIQHKAVAVPFHWMTIFLRSYAVAYQKTKTTGKKNTTMQHLRRETPKAKIRCSSDFSKGTLLLPVFQDFCSILQFCLIH